MALALLKLLPQRDMNLPPTKVKYPGPNFTSDRFWADGMPDLGQLARGDSFLVFNILELSNESLQEWFQSPVEEWSDNVESPDYKIAFDATKVMAMSLDVTNDNVESSLKGLKDRIVLS